MRPKLLVSELLPGMLLELDNSYKYYFQDSRKSVLPRLRTAPDVIASMVGNVTLDKKQNPVMYLGETSKHIVDVHKRSRKKLRTIMVDGQVAYIEGKEFKRFNPIFSESS